MLVIRSVDEYLIQFEEYYYQHADYIGVCVCVCGRRQYLNLNCKLKCLSFPRNCWHTLTYNIQSCNVVWLGKTNNNEFPWLVKSVVIVQQCSLRQARMSGLLTFEYDFDLILAQDVQFHRS